MSLRDGVTLVWKQAAEPKSLDCADETEPDTLRACARITSHWPSGREAPM